MPTLDQPGLNTRSSRPKVLCFADYFTPGFKAGGTVRSVANLVTRLTDSLEFAVITRDRDLGDTHPFDGVAPDRWASFGPAKVLYASPRTLQSPALVRVLRDVPHDVRYFNSLFSPSLTFWPLALARFGLIDARPTIIAPRGECGVGALSLRKGVKAIHRVVSRALSIFEGVLWQASTEHEAEDIVRVMRVSRSSVFMAADVPSIPQDVGQQWEAKAACQHVLRIVFLGRIVPVKNLHFLLEALVSVRSRVKLTVHGPVEDAAYWERCMLLAEALPTHVEFEYGGSVHPDRVPRTLSEHDLCALPSLGENYGHVIPESLGVGTPVLVSDQTVWRHDPAAGISVVAIRDPRDWAQEIERVCSLDERKRMARRQGALGSARSIGHADESLESHRRMFAEAIRRWGSSRTGTS